jgi:RNA polymerase sigma factor (sigma-70 family)
MSGTRLASVLHHLRSSAHRNEELSDAELLKQFGAMQDPAAFDALMRRHGALVWRVCRRVLRQTEAAEDAFQATFLVLARRAGAIRKPAALPSWLHGVAYRISRKARTRLGRGQTLAADASAEVDRDPPREAVWRELGQIVEEEVHGLSEKYRLPILLCYWEGESNQEIARRLGWPSGTVKTRLAKARSLLHARLVRRGVALPAGVAAVLLGVGNGNAPAAVLLAAERAVFTEVPVAVADLTQDELMRNAPGYLKFVIALMLGATSLALAAGAMGRPPAEEKHPGGAGLVARALALPGEPRAAGADRHGDALPEEAISLLGTTRWRLDDSMIVGFLAFTPDSDTLVWHGHTGTFLWEVASGKLRHRLPPPVKSDAFSFGQSLSPDGKWLAIPSRSGVQLREVATARLVRTLGTADISHAQFSPDGKTLAVRVRSPEGDPIEFWDLLTERKVGSLKTPRTLTPFQYADGGKTIVTPQQDGSFFFWDIATGQVGRQLKLGAPGWRRAFSPDGERLALMGYRESGWYDDLRVWDTYSGKEQQRLAPAVKERTRRPPYHALAEASFLDNRTLVTAGLDDTIIVWDLVAGKELRRFGDEVFNPIALAIAPDGSKVAVATGAASVRVFDLQTGKDLFATAGTHHLAIQEAVFTPVGKTVATAGGKRILLWDPATGAPRGRLEGHRDYVTALKILPDGRTLLSSAADGTLRFWDVSTAQELRRLEIDPDRTGFKRILATSRDGKLLALGGVGSAAVVMDMQTGKERRRLSGHDKMVYGAAFDPDARTLTTWDGKNRVRVWELSTGQVRREFSFPEELERPRAVSVEGVFSDPVAVSPDGRMIVYGSGREGTRSFDTVRLIDLSSGVETRWLGKYPNPITVVAISPDGKTLAVGHSGSPTIHLVEVLTGQERHRLSGANSMLTTLAFSADGRMLISGHTDTTALVWDLSGRVSAGAQPGETLSPGELEALWADLAGLDGGRAYRALRRLAAVPEQSLRLLQGRLQPVAPVDDRRITVLLADLDSTRFAVRDQATRELEAMGEAAVPAYQRALKGKLSFEAGRRVESLLNRQDRQDHSPAPERLRALRALEILETIATPEANRFLQTLASGLPGARITEEARAAFARRAATR